MLSRGRWWRRVPTELLEPVSSNVLRFKTDGALPAARWKAGAVTGRIVQLPAQDAAQIEHYLATEAPGGLGNWEDIEIRKADLEDVFLDVMGAVRAANQRTSGRGR